MITNPVLEPFKLALVSHVIYPLHNAVLYTAEMCRNTTFARHLTLSLDRSLNGFPVELLCLGDQATR